MDTISLIFSILGFVVGVIGVLVSYFGWRYVKRRTIEPTKIHKQIVKMLKKNPDMENPYSLDGDLLDQTCYCLFNMIKNLHLYE